LSCFREAYILSVPSTYVGKFEIKVMLAKQTYSKVKNKLIQLKLRQTIDQDTFHTELT